MSTPYYAPPLCNLAYIRRDRQFQSSETADDALLHSYILEASADFGREGLQRVCAPYIDSQEVGIDKRYGRELWVDDLLAITTLTNAGGSIIGSGSYNLRPRNVYPKDTIELTAQSGAYWDFPYVDSSVTVDGTFGYVPHYGAHLRNSGVTIPAGNLSSSATTLALGTGQGANFSAGDILFVDNEAMYVTPFTADTLVLERGQLGTTAAAHTSSAAIRIYQQLSDIQMAVRLIVGYYYKSRPEIGARVTVYNGGVVTTADLDPAVERIRKKHRRYQRILAV